MLGYMRLLRLLLLRRCLVIVQWHPETLLLLDEMLLFLVR